MSSGHSARFFAMSFPVGIPVALAMLAALLQAPGCTRKSSPVAPPSPTEKVAVVVADPAPGLRKINAHQHPDLTARQGDVVMFVKASDSLEWKDKIDGEAVARSGPLIEVKLGTSGASFFMWASDVRRDVPAVTTSYLCSKIPGAPANRPPCEQALQRRLLPDGTTVGFIRCPEGPCPVVTAGPSGTQVKGIEGLNDLRVARFGETNVVIAVNHFSSATKTGRELSVLRAADLSQLGVIPLEGADHSKPGLLSWQLGWFKVLPEGIRLQGERAVVDQATNKQLEAALINDLWVLTPQGTLERRAAAPAASPEPVTSGRVIAP